jgi:acyl-CoA synthetase (AMP-forming)/AMP-acid ligase II
MNRDLSAVARSAKVDHLDDAIDRVAARLTQVADDPALAARIVATLPQRRVGLAHGWVARFAVGALATLTIAVVLRTFNGRSTEVLRTEKARTLIVELARTVTAEAPGTAIVERLQNRLGTVVEPPAKSDYEFSLNALASPEALGLRSLTTDDLPAEDALAIAPLAIADLPLTAEFSQR